MKKLCVIVPVYKDSFSSGEEMAIDRTVKVLRNRDIFFVAPNRLSVKYYQTRYNCVQIKRFANKYFKSVRTYNRLMLNCSFYATFKEYDYMLIAQPDAIILSSSDYMDFFMEKGFDYWGAPWQPALKISRFDLKGIHKLRKLVLPVICESGNGGFSLRKIDSTIRLLSKHWFTSRLWCHNFNEDGFFSYFAHSERCCEYSCPSREQAAKFALEVNMREELENGMKPYALHAWEKYMPDVESLTRYME